MHEGEEKTIAGEPAPKRLLLFLTSTRLLFLHGPAHKQGRSPVQNRAISYRGKTHCPQTTLTGL